MVGNRGMGKPSAVPITERSTNLRHLVVICPV
jgi:hypothetical protein